MQPIDTKNSLIDALPANLALIDGQGTITAVNEGWRQFALQGGLPDPNFCVGQNYFDICLKAEPDCLDAALAREGISKILRGESSRFDLEYPCHSPQEEQWFQLLVSPIRESSCAVIMHVDITEKRAAREAQRLLSEQLAAEKSRLLEAQAVARMGSWETDLTTLEMIWSDEAYRIFETDRERLPVPNLDIFLQFVHPDDRQAVDQAFSETLREGCQGTCFITHRILLGGKRVKYLDQRWAVQYGPNGDPPLALGTCQDVTERKLVELELARTNRALQMLTACSEALIHAQSEAVLLHRVCEIAHEIGGYRMAWVGYADRGDKHAVAFQAYAGEESGYLQEVQREWAGQKSVFSEGPAGRVLSSGRALVCEDIEQDPGFSPFLRAAQKRGYRGVICLPLPASEGPFGVLALYAPHVIQASQEELELLQRLANDLAFGIQNLRGGEKRKRLENAVMRVATAVSASTGEQFFQNLVKNMAEAFGAKAAFIGRILAVEPPQVKTIAAVADTSSVETAAYPLAASPLSAGPEPELVVCDEFATECPHLQTLAARAYVGRKLIDTEGRIVGTIDLAFAEPLTETDWITSTLQIFAARAASDLERQRIEDQLRDQAALLDAAHEAIYVKDMEDRIVYWNGGAERVYGWTAEEARGRTTLELFQPDLERVTRAQFALRAVGEWHGELEKLTKSGRRITADISWTLVRDSSGLPKAVLAINQDVTEKKKLEAQFLRAQRMESLGTLASGIAHDLNNVLTPILLSVGTLQHIIADPDGQGILETVERSARRGADLVKQVLGFAKGVQGKRIAVHPGRLMQDLYKIMHDTFPKSINLYLLEPPDLWIVPGDPTQLHQVFLNLCVNARDAMQMGGRLTIELENLVIDDVFASMDSKCRPGPYVMISVEDSGTGISAEVREKIFEPFFTTKEVGQGTGLGLSTTLAIVRSHGGFINLYSEPGKGTTFKVYLPADDNLARQAPDLPSDSPNLQVGNGELVLVVDDDEAVRAVARATLERYGYRVELACHGAEAVAIYARRMKDIAVVLTDLTMPIMDGPAMIVAIRAMNPQARIVCSSGLTLNDAAVRARQAGARHFISKPYTAASMLTVLHQVLHTEEGPYGNSS